MIDIEQFLVPAPAGESLEKIRERVLTIALFRTANSSGSESIYALAVLWQRHIEEDEPTADEWTIARDNFALTLALAPTLDLDLTLALALAPAPAPALDLDLISLLGDRLTAVDGLDQAIYAAVSIEHRFALDMSSWHGKLTDGCGTTHCRAGSAIALHPLGADLERVFGPRMAGAVIYLKSTGSVPDFFADTDTAMADIKRCAGITS